MTNDKVGGGTLSLGAKRKTLAELKWQVVDLEMVFSGPT